jgi:hypothetical protein
VHQKTTLGIGGRRVLVSRDWSGKTLADHRADSHAWVKALLGITSDTPDGDQAEDQHEAANLVWEIARPGDPDMPPLEHRLLRGISQRIQQRAQLTAARQYASGDGDPPPTVSATVTPREGA